MSPVFQSLLWVGALVAATGAQASVHDAVADFSTTVNTDSSPWSYRTSTSAAHDGNYPLLPNFGPFAGFSGPSSGLRPAQAAPASSTTARWMPARMRG